jgi:Peptidase M50B-like
MPHDAETVPRLRGFFQAPALDTWHGLEHCLDLGGAKALAWLFAGLLVGYWVYVPLHELGHALACLAFGGEVTRLEIDPKFGAALLAKVFPWVVPGGEYAGRLAGFDTHGSDLVYLATDLGPFLLTLLPGVWWLRKTGRTSHSFLFGASLPFALAPFLSLTGDAYEIGSILVSQVPPWSGESVATLLRGDDLFKKAPELAAHAGAPWVGFGLATVVGVLWAFGTYALSGWIAGRLGQAPLEETAGRGERAGSAG